MTSCLSVNSVPTMKPTSPRLVATRCSPSVVDDNVSTAEVAATESVLAEYVPQLRAFIASRIKNHQDVDDLLQDTLVKSMQTAQADQIRNPLAYGLQVARTVVYDHWRRHQRQPEMVEEDDQAMTVSLEKQHIDRQQLELLQQVIMNLPELRRQVFVLRRLEGLSRQEIAERLDINEESVKKHISRAMVNIARAMEKAGY